MNDMTSAFQALFANARTPAEQAAIRQRYAETMMGQAQDDRAMKRQDRNYARSEPARQFDANTGQKENLLRMILGGSGMGGGEAMSQPYGGGQPQTAYGQGDGWRGGQFTGEPQGFQMTAAQPGMRPAVDPMQKNLDNYLAQLLGRR